MKLILFLFLFTQSVLAQQTTYSLLKIGDHALIDPSAILELKSTSRGILYPRMTTTQKNAISSPATGLVVYDTSLSQLSAYNGAAWVSASGTVTSIALTVPTFLSVSGSPITTSGTFAITLSGTALPTANGGTGNVNGAIALGTTVAVSNSASYFPLFVAASANGNQAFNLGTGLTFNPSTNNLSTTTFTGAFTGAVTGTASGNTTYTANNHGVVLSGSGNTMTVIAPDASVSKVLTSGGSSADPTWQPPGATTAITASYNNTSGQSINSASATTVTNWTLENDTNSMCVASTGVCTIPSNGKYNVMFQCAGGNSLTGAKFISSIRKNGTTIRQGGQFVAGGTENDQSPSLVVLLGYTFATNDTIDFQYFQNSGGPATLYTADTTIVYFSIQKVGN